MKKTTIIRYVIDVPLGHVDDVQDFIEAWHVKLVSRDFVEHVVQAGLPPLKLTPKKGNGSMQVGQPFGRIGRIRRMEPLSDGRAYRHLSTDEICKIYKARGTYRAVAERFKTTDTTVEKIKRIRKPYYRVQLIKGGAIAPDSALESIGHPAAKTVQQ